MKDKKSVRHLLNEKHKGFWTISPDDTVRDALELMIANDVGAVAVLENDALVGIVTERDWSRKVLMQDKPARTTPIRDVMTTRVLYVSMDQTIDECMALMTKKGIRHLPVLDNGKLVGIVSIRDVVRYTISQQEFMIEQLENYIMDRRA
jgi:CBS domain-containing protein